jgi:hypothetical protein
MNLLQKDSKDLGLLLWTAQQLLALQTPPYTDPLQLAMSSDTGTGVQSCQGGDPVNVPPWWYGVSGGTGLLLVSCTQGAQMGTKLVNGWYSDVINFGGQRVNSFAVSCAAAINSAIASADLPPVSRVYNCGYSLGGAIAQVVTQQQIVAKPSGSYLCITFGSPCVGNYAWASSWSNASQVRIMNQADPVPLLPPKIADAPIFATLLTRAQLDFFNGYVGSAGGWVLSNGGTLGPGELPPLATLAGVGQLSAFFLGQLTPGVSEHYLPLYISRLTVAVAKYPPTSRQPAAPAPAQRTVVVSSGQYNRAQAGVVANLRGLQETQDVAVVSIPNPYRFTYLRVGSIFLIYLGQQYVASTPLRRRAQRIVGVGNDWLKRMQSLAVVDQAGLLAELEVYLSAASTPGNGFTPTLNTTWPG